MLVEAATFWTGIVMTGLVVAVILATEAPFGSLGNVSGLMIRLAAKSLAWLALMVLFVKRRVLVLPTPLAGAAGVPKT